MRVLIIGQGIAGTWLSYLLLKAGIEVIVIDNEQPDSATRVASGVINPVTGRQVVTSWLAESLLPLSETAYREMENRMGATYIQNCGIYAFPPSEQMVGEYQKKIQEGSLYINPLPANLDFAPYFHFYYPPFHIQPAYYVDLQLLLSDYRSWLKNQGFLFETVFEEENLTLLDSGIQYHQWTADYVFYCQGVAVSNSVYWKGLPFALTKGQALIVDIPQLPKGQIYKFGTNTIVPWKTGLWWVGSTYEHNFTSQDPTPEFFNKTSWFLTQILSIPFHIEEHLSSMRPSTLERRPFAGFHPRFSKVGVLGGLGTKGVSLSPWLAIELVNYLIENKPLNPAIDVSRYRRAFL